VIQLDKKHINNTRILVVDDDQLTRMTIKKILQKAGYQVTDTDRGDKAISLCINELPDLVLLDLMMPGIDGYDTCKALRQVADYNQLPIIILTGLDDIESIDKAFESGSTDFVTKPINWSLLTQRVRYALRTKELFHELIKSQQKLTRAQNLVRIGYWELDCETNIISLFDKTKYLLGLTSDAYPMNELLSHMSDIDADRIRHCIQTTIETGTPYTIDHSFINHDGVALIINQQGELSDQHDRKLITGTIQDITERKQAEELIYFHRYHDPATSLPNKEFLQLQLDDLIRQDQGEFLTAVISLSFDKLRSIGGTIGEDFINQFLRQSCERLLRRIPEIRSISRISTTTCGFLLSNMHTIEQIELICNLIINYFIEPLSINNHEYHTTLSIGITVYPIDDSTSLIQNAIIAQKVCFSQGGSRFLFYSFDMELDTKKQISLESAIRRGLENNEFHAYFQPQINTSNEQVTGMEALTRWITSDGEIIPPDKFIPIAEETGLIIELGIEIMKQSCHFAKQLQDSGHGTIRVGVNLSSLQFSDKNLLTTIDNMLADSGLDPSQLEIEITESIAMTDISHAINTLKNIRSMGIKTSMDDFGTGYSSLSYLQKLPLDTLKVDQSFIRPIGENYENSEIARAIIAMGKSLNMHLIAEGVEEAHHYKLLKKLHCNEVQGYYFSKPLAQNEFIRFIEKKSYLKH